jgi:hypothetical protein
MLGKEQYIRGRIPSIGNLLDLAARGLKSLQTTLANVWIEMHLEQEYYATPLDAMVPTAAPREILVNPRMLQKMTYVGPVHFLVSFNEKV